MTDPISQVRLDHALVDALTRARNLYISAVTSQDRERLDTIRFGQLALSDEQRYELDAKLSSYLREAAKVAGEIFDAEVYRSMPELTHMET